MAYTKEDLRNQLDRMDAPAGKIVLMHTSLRAVGAVEGGAQALLDVLEDISPRISVI